MAQTIIVSRGGGSSSGSSGGGDTGGAALSPSNIMIFNEMWHTSKIEPFFTSAISGGSVADGYSDANHPGYMKFKSSTSANSGYRYGAASPYANYRLSAGMEYHAIIRPITNTDVTITAGFADNTDHGSEATDGAYFRIEGGVATGKTANNGTRTSTGTTQALTLNTWYHLKIVVGASEADVTFYIYTDDGTEVWSDSVTTNIPTAAGRETGHQFIATSSNTTAEDLVDVDFLGTLMNIQRGG